MDERQVRQANELLALVGGVLTIVVMTRIVLGPDAIKRVKMHGYLVVSHTAKRGVDMLTTVAMNADTAYHKCRNVTV